MENEVKKEENLPLVSVCIPAYNHEKYVAEAIQSVIDQDYRNIELIIINDGSKDTTHEMIMKFEEKCKERFVRFEYRNRENRGLSATLNEIVEWSNGKYFTGVASDDVMSKNKVSLLVNELENLDETYAVAFGNAIFIDDNSNQVYIDRETGLPTDKEKGFKLFLDYYTMGRNMNYRDKNVFGSYETLIAGNYLPAMSYVIKLDKIREVGAWTSGNTIEDWEMWLKLSKQYKFAYVDEPVALYRWHDTNSMKTNTLQLEIDTMNLLLRDKDYAVLHNYKLAWESHYFNNLITFLKQHEFRLFLKYIFSVSIHRFSIFLIKKIIKKIKSYTSKFIGIK